MANGGDGRADEPRGDIFIHGDAVSIGCLAIGDRAIENLFVLVADVGIEHVQVIIAPHDPRGGIRLAPIVRQPFTADLCRRIEESLDPFGNPIAFCPADGTIASPSSTFGMGE